MSQPGVDVGCDSSFNASQVHAIMAALTRLWTAIQGPPGTGKTKVLCMIVKLLIQMAESSNWKTRNTADVTRDCERTDQGEMKQEIDSIIEKIRDISSALD
jgi:Ni2+-binding GTPase involved in maturation of urease and hydrogenase